MLQSDTSDKLIGQYIITGVAPNYRKSSIVIQEHLSDGAFGRIYVGTNEETGERVAIKMEGAQVKCPQLYLEFGFYRQLGDAWCLPKVHAFGGCLDLQWTAMALDLLGPSLLKVYNKSASNFSLTVSALLAIKLFEIIEFVHEKGIIYRDVKPENFVINQPLAGERTSQLYLIDLGLCKDWRTATGEHIPAATEKPITGTLPYMSHNMHLGYELSRRDDLEALLNMVVFLHRGTLPWCEIPSEKEKSIGEKVMWVGEQKANTKPAELFSGMTDSFPRVYSQIRELKFEEKPAYREYIDRFVAIVVPSTEERAKIRDTQTDRVLLELPDAKGWSSNDKPQKSNRCSVSREQSGNRFKTLGSQEVMATMSKPKRTISCKSARSRQSRQTLKTQKTGGSKGKSGSRRSMSHYHLMLALGKKAKSIVKSRKKSPSL